MLDHVKDQRRLDAVQRSGLVGSQPEVFFDELTASAASLLDAPFAFMTAVDDQVSYWKSTVGVDDGKTFDSVEDSFCQYVIEQQDDLIVNDVTIDPITRANPSIGSMGIRAWAGCPVFMDGEILGTFCVVDQHTRVWTDRDRNVLRTFAAAASREIKLRSELEAAERDLTAARTDSDNLRSALDTIRESLFPPDLPAIEGLELAVWFQPAAGGLFLGDFHDVFPLSNGVWGIVIGDVCGHGVDAARLTSLVRYSMRAAAVHHDDPADVLSEVTAALCDDTIDPGRFATSSFLRIGTNDGFQVTHSRAGHTHPVMTQPDGSARVLETATGLPLGILREESSAFSTNTFTLQRGETLFLYTDGLIESRSRDGNEMLGEAGLHRLLADSHTPTSSAASIIDDVERFVTDTARRCSDDLTILAIRRPALD